jgi:hypothetical protein
MVAIHMGDERAQLHRSSAGAQKTLITGYHKMKFCVHARFFSGLYIFSNLDYFLIENLW